MATLGLFPEEPSRPRSPLRWAFAILVVGFAGTTFFAVLEIRRLAGERDRERARVAELEKLLGGPAPPLPAPPSAAPLSAPPAAEPSAPAPPAVSPSPRAPLSSPEPSRADLDRREARERLERGIEELRAGRYGPAELHLFRAVPDSYLYLALSSLARGDLREAAAFLARAQGADPRWLRRIRPAEVLSPEEYARLLAALEDRVRQNPLDVEAKTLLAYLHYHEKGPAYAKALLLEAAAVQPDDPEIRGFLEELERP
jgi:tetratricopeptide (TPR) repeat protein